MESDAHTSNMRPHVGRKGLVRNLLARLERGQSLLLYGGPKLGKTSLLRHLEASLNRDPEQPAAYLDLDTYPRLEPVPSSLPRARYLLVDNCDRLSDGEAARFIGSLQRRAGRALVWAGGRPWREFAVTQPAAADLRLHPVPLAVLLPSEARELAGPGLRAEEIDWLLSQGGTHPYYLATLRAELLAARAVASHDVVLKTAINRLQPCFAACLRALFTPTEARVLDHLVRQAAPLNPKTVCQALDLPTVKPEADVLAYLGMISRWNMAEGAVLHVGSGAFVTWYLTRADGDRTSA